MYLIRKNTPRYSELCHGAKKLVELGDESIQLDMDSTSLPSLITQLCNLLHNPGFLGKLSSAINRSKLKTSEDAGHGSEYDGEKHSAHNQLFLRIEATLCQEQPYKPHDDSLLLGCIDLQNGKLLASPATPVTSNHSSDSTIIPSPPQSTARSPRQDFASHLSKRRKTVSGLRLAPSTASNADQTESDSDSQCPPTPIKRSIRQFHCETRFPQRKKPRNDGAPPVLEPTSADKLIAGIWKQVYSPVKLSHFSSVQGPEPALDIRTGVSGDVFRAVSTLCLKYYNQSQSMRAMEMIVQAYWIECYESRISVIGQAHPHLPPTEIRMMALREACSVLQWKEKDLRNRMAIWRGYAQIRDSGGWASLIFASAGVYRFCKYRTGFTSSFSTQLRHLRPSIEVAADTLHPEWRDLLLVIGQTEPRKYHGHPHEWVIPRGGAPAVPLASTYRDGFQYEFIEACRIDAGVFGEEDPRRVEGVDAEVCGVCGERQADEVERNRCLCFPSLFGCVRAPAPVQVFHTPGKNNGVIARLPLPRGLALFPFLGLLTRGITGRDVMLGGSSTQTPKTSPRPYQILQTPYLNISRFINHSCRPNSQFQRFIWRGLEQIIVVSRGIAAGSEITVDYSDGYWAELDLECRCGEGGCRFRRGKEGGRVG
ncbi:SET domain protein [Rutstroemia sp. NJR-2017a BVV2]|nr:SET domain protein [Rutstroemia sp. NJR-2017a BVV2]